MGPLFETDSIEKRLQDEECVVRVNFRIVPRPVTWLFPDRDDLVDAIAVGPKNAKFWWILPKNYTFI